MGYLKSTVGLLTLLLLLAGCISIPTGDGGKINVSKDGLAIEERDGEKSEINFDTDDGGYTLETEDGVAKVGSQAAIPDAFPKDIYLPQNATLTISNETDENSYMLTYEVIGNMVDDQDIYKNFLTENGYAMEEINLADQMMAFQGRKEGDHFINYQMLGQEERSYSLTIIYGKLDK